MGYTHYWRLRRPENNAQLLQRDTAYQSLQRDCWRLFEIAALKGVALAGPLGEGDPETTSDAVAFNGKAPADYETFEFPRTPPAFWYGSDGLAFGFCKTAQRPYDPAVVAVLLLAHRHYGGALEISSDGDAHELAPGVALLSAAFPERPPYNVAAFFERSLTASLAG